MIINTPADWWEAFEANQENLRDAVRGYHPSLRMLQSAQRSMKIPAERAENLCELERKRITEKNTKDPIEEFDLAASNKDHETLVRLLNQTWFGVPESTGCWSIPSFGVLCDLCSESWVFEESEKT